MIEVTGLPLLFQEKIPRFSLIFSVKSYLFFSDSLTTHTYSFIISLNRYGVLESLEPIFGCSIFGFYNRTALQNDCIEQHDILKGRI